MIIRLVKQALPKTPEEFRRLNCGERLSSIRIFDYDKMKESIQTSSRAGSETPSPSEEFTTNEEMTVAVALLDLVVNYLISRSTILTGYK
jgi:hypothetical protein